MALNARSVAAIQSVTGRACMLAVLGVGIAPASRPPRGAQDRRADLSAAPCPIGMWAHCDVEACAHKKARARGARGAPPPQGLPIAPHPRVRPPGATVA